MLVHFGKGGYAEYANYFYDTSVIFSNSIITSFAHIGKPSQYASVMTDGPMLLA